MRSALRGRLALGVPRPLRGPGLGARRGPAARGSAGAGGRSRGSRPGLPAPLREAPQLGGERGKEGDPGKGQEALAVPSRVVPSVLRQQGRPRWGAGASGWISGVQSVLSLWIQKIDNSLSKCSEPRLFWRRMQGTVREVALLS